MIKKHEQKHFKKKKERFLSFQTRKYGLRTSFYRDGLVHKLIPNKNNLAMKQ